MGDKRFITNIPESNIDTARAAADICEFSGMLYIDKNAYDILGRPLPPGNVGLYLVGSITEEDESTFLHVLSHLKHELIQSIKEQGYDLSKIPIDTLLDRIHLKITNQEIEALIKEYS